MILPTDIREKLGEKTVIFADSKYLLVELDSANWGIYDRQTLKKTKHIASALLSYCPPGIGAFKALLQLEANENLREKSKKNDPYRSLEALLEGYAKSLNMAFYGLQEGIDRETSDPPEPTEEVGVTD